MSERGTHRYNNVECIELHKVWTQTPFLNLNQRKRVQRCMAENFTSIYTHKYAEHVGYPFAYNNAYTSGSRTTLWLFAWAHGIVIAAGRCWQTLVNTRYMNQVENDGWA